MKILVILFIFISSSYADIVQDLHTEIEQDFIPKLTDKFGDCGEKSCIEFNDGKYYFKGADKKVCLPWTACSFYSCMEEKYKCESQKINYFTELAEPTCNQYVKNIGNNYYSQEGKEWVYSVMVCLQKGLIEECEINENCDLANPRVSCPHIVEFTLDYHPGCYTNSGVGVCHLSFQDKWRIWNTVYPFMTKRERKQAWKVVWYCLTPNKSEMPRGF
jgi:hypothetical protein